MIHPSHADHLRLFASLAADCADCSLTLNQLDTYQRKHGLWTLSDSDQTVVGFIAGRLVLDEAELDQILIDPAHRQHGFAARSLLRWHDLLAEQGIRWIYLEVREQNEPAVRLYERLGYEHTGRRKNYYRQAGASGDALMMKKTL